MGWRNKSIDIFISIEKFDDFFVSLDSILNFFLRAFVSGLSLVDSENPRPMHNPSHLSLIRLGAFDYLLTIQN